MAESGLRFDIFERVHLETEVDGLDNLEELELLPHIELSAAGQQTILKGYLELTGQYTNVRSDKDGSRLRHRIPVNISMPSERVLDAQELGVEIDHFDIDLLSSRLLNVTGVLYLRGVESAETRPSTAPTNEAGEQYFVHEAPQFPQAEADRSPTEAEQELTIEQQAEAASQQTNAVNWEPEASDQRTDAANWEPEASEQRTGAANWEAEASEQQTQSAEERNSDEAEQLEERDAAEESEEVQQEAPKEMKIAFAGKSAETLAESDVETVHAEEEAPSEQAVTEKAQWKNLFLPKEEAEENQFRKLRMCIVQKEETLTSIAERYNLNPREIVLYNRLGEQQDVAEGQVIYIPKV